MSTKIYDGLRLADPNADLFEVISQVALAVEKSFGRLALKLIGEELARACDNREIRESIGSKRDLFFEVEKRWNESQKSWGSHHALNDPLRFSIVFGRSSAGNILSVPFYSGKNYDSALKSTKLFRKYGYWDNVDPLPGVSKTDWELRGEEWDSILSKDGALDQLPTWQLPRSEEPFSHMLLRAPDRLDLNKYRTQEERLRHALMLALADRIAAGAKFQPQMIFQAERTVRVFMETPEAAAVPRPEPLPVGNIFVKAESLPPLYEPADELLDRLLELSKAVNS